MTNSVEKSVMTEQIRAALLAAAARAGAAIPPAWPLASSVAVNPYLGQAQLGLAETAALLERVAGVPMTMPRSWYLQRIATGEISDDDLTAACAAAPAGGRVHTVEALKAAASVPVPVGAPLPTVADIAADHSATDWPAMIAERLGGWAAGHFDQGQALWAPPAHRSAYAAWRAAATHDLTPEIMGLKGFAQRVADAPVAAADMVLAAAGRLGIAAAAAETYFHRLLITLGGWSHYARYLGWQAGLRGERDDSIVDLLAIRLVWEVALLDHFAGAIGDGWAAAVAAYDRPLVPTDAQRIDALLQEAWERGAQRRLAARLAAARDGPECGAAARIHAVFCIDVRSEIFRRGLESLDPGITTAGFAGFFGLGAGHRRFASDVVEHRLPVLLNPGVTSAAGGEPDRDFAHRLGARAGRAWGRFKLAAVSSFAFVEASGPVYAGKLVRDALGMKAPARAADPAPRFDPPLDLAARTAMAASILRAMSLTKDFAPLVLLIGHGASVTNNPHASALHCGACGGHSGEVNARLLAGLLNDDDVRAGLAADGIDVPPVTLFVAGLHDTTNDAVRLYPDDPRCADRRADLAQAERWLGAAGALARCERALRLPRAAAPADIARRTRDWAETRPEWALAGCRAFIAAPRAQTRGRDLGGAAFLHDYDWRSDAGYGVLELIMTAPVVVASWISLQYYGSSVAPELFGGGNKLLHNVVGGIGVVEGNGGLPRAGLPWQSVHDGRQLMHEPLRLTVCIKAPCAAMSDILSRHDGVRALFDNRWLHLFALDDQGRMASRYAGNLCWEALHAPARVPDALELAA